MRYPASEKMEIIRTVEASVSADLAVHTSIEGTEPPYVEQIAHGGALPDLPIIKINLYHSGLVRGEPFADLLEFPRAAYRGL